MTNPLGNFKALTSDLLIHGISIVENYTEAVSAFKNEDYESYGEHIGKILKLASVKSQQVKQTEIKKLDRKDVASVAQGFLEATHVGHFNFTALLECVYDADKAAKILDSSVNMLEDAYKKKDLHEAIGGIIGTLAFIKDVKQTVPLCESVKNTPQNWNTFDNIFETIKSPNNHIAVIGKNIIFNKKNISNEISAAMEAWRGGDYYAFGN